MPTTSLRKVGGSIMMVVPPAILDQLGLRAGAAVTLAVEGQRIVVEPERKPRYTLDQLLTECDARAVESAEDREWLSTPPVGRELL
jgi:antitoxin ChpS